MNILHFFLAISPLIKFVMFTIQTCSDNLIRLHIQTCKKKLRISQIFESYFLLFFSQFEFENVSKLTNSWVYFKKFDYKSPTIIFFSYFCCSHFVKLCVLKWTIKISKMNELKNLKLDLDGTYFLWFMGFLFRN